MRVTGANTINRLASLIVFAALTSPVAAQTESQENYIGSAVCADCHEAVYDRWTKSHHALAWVEPNDTTVLGDFNGTFQDHNAITHTFSKKGGTFYIETDGPDQALVTYPVAGVVGVSPLQQYLIETEKGRVQTHDVAWDAQENRWYHLYPDQILKAGDGLHWTGPYKNWASRCAECHATGFEKHYDPNVRKFKSTQAEIGVGCEACHGPGSAHQAWTQGEIIKPNQGLDALGFVLNFSAENAETEIQQCAGCHSRREPLSDISPLPGTPFYDSYRLALLRDGLYHADGSILDEVYVYGSFLQSKMYANGVRCSDCHDVHSGEQKLVGNAVCTQCHSASGNGRFPTLTKANYDSSEHHFHKDATAGAECKSCHMIERTYMQIDGRRDHSFRVPRPDLSEKTGAPNACIDCHTDQENDWAASVIAKQFPSDDNRSPHYAEIFAPARLSPVENLTSLIDVAEDLSVAAIVRATALEMLSGTQDPEIIERAAILLNDAHPLVRENAVGLQRAAEPSVRVERLVPLMSDPLRSVRIAAARAFVGTPATAVSADGNQALRQAMDDFRHSLRAKADFPETHMVIGGTALTTRNWKAAEAAFAEAVLLDPQMEQAWSILVRIRAATENRQGAQAAMKQGLEHNPTSTQLLTLKKELQL